MKNSFALLVLCLCGSLTCLVGCSGGGGGGGGRTTETAIRIVHGSVDGSPVTLMVDGEILQTASFAEVTVYAPVDNGDRLLTVERANSPGMLVSQNLATLEKDTEYTLFAFGEVRTSGLSVNLLTDVIERPEEGFASVQVLNALNDSRSISVTIDDADPETASVESGQVRFGSGSSFFTVASGLTTFTVRDRNGTRLARRTVEIEDRGEVMLLVTGSLDLDVVFTRVYTDLD